jgi:type VI secretion system secreted protein VgrG
MKNKFLILVAFVVLLYGSSTGLAGPSVLGTAQSFAVLSHETVTNTGSTTIYGSLGVNPGSAITGFPPGIVSLPGTTHAGDAVAGLALGNATAAYTNLFNRSVTQTLTGHDLGTVGTLSPGVYFFATSAQLTGALTLDFSDDPDGDFIFQIGSTLTTASSSTVNVINGGANSGVYWQVGTSATLGTSTMFAGNILALASVTLNTNADILCGRAIALTGAVTLDDNRISNNNTAEDFGSGRNDDFGSYGFSGGGSAAPVVPVPGAFLLVTIGMASLSVFRKRTLILK